MHSCQQKGSDQQTALMLAQPALQLLRCALANTRNSSDLQIHKYPLATTTPRTIRLPSSPSAQTLAHGLCRFGSEPCLPRVHDPLSTFLLRPKVACERDRGWRLVRHSAEGMHHLHLHCIVRAHCAQFSGRMFSGLYWPFTQLPKPLIN